MLLPTKVNLILETLRYLKSEIQLPWINESNVTFLGRAHKPLCTARIIVLYNSYRPLLDIFKQVIIQANNDWSLKWHKTIVNRNSRIHSGSSLPGCQHLGPARDGLSSRNGDSRIPDWNLRLSSDCGGCSHGLVQDGGHLAQDCVNSIANTLSHKYQVAWTSLWNLLN